MKMRHIIDAELPRSLGLAFTTIFLNLYPPGVSSGEQRGDEVDHTEGSIEHFFLEAF